jgi:hypothetical protein
MSLNTAEFNQVFETIRAFCAPISICRLFTLVKQCHSLATLILATLIGGVLFPYMGEGVCHR